MTDERARQHLHSVFNHLAPSSVEQNALQNVIHEMRRLDENEVSICRMIAGAIVDGLTGGNWVA